MDYTVHGVAQRRTRLSNCHFFLEGIWLAFVIAGFFLNIKLLFFRFSDYCDFISLGPLFNVPAAAAKSLQSRPTLCDPTDGSPPGSPVPGILQARTLEWVAISFFNAGKWKVKVKSLSRVRLFVTPWTAAYQAPPSMGFSRQEYWSGVPWGFLKSTCHKMNSFSLLCSPKLPSFLYSQLLIQKLQ